MQVTPEQETAAGVTAEEQQAADDAAKWLENRSRAGQMSHQVAERRNQAVAACVNEGLERAGGAVLCIIGRCHAVLLALGSRGLHEAVMAERANHLPERMHGSRLAIDEIVGELGIEHIVERNAGEFDQEQLLFDVKRQLTQILRELI
jgi:hypothetical protein